MLVCACVCLCMCVCVSFQHPSGEVVSLELGDERARRNVELQW